jgi:hypothetical protein
MALHVADLATGMKPLNASWRYLVHVASLFNTTCSPEYFWWCILAMVRQKKKHWYLPITGKIISCLVMAGYGPVQLKLGSSVAVFYY